MYIKDLFNIFIENYRPSSDMALDPTKEEKTARSIYGDIVSAASRVKDADAVNKIVSEILAARTGIYPVDPEKVPVIRGVLQEQVNRLIKPTVLSYFRKKKPNPYVDALKALDQTLQIIENGTSLDVLYQHYIYKEEVINALDEISYRIKSCHRKEIMTSVVNFKRTLLEVLKLINEMLDRYTKTLNFHDPHWQSFYKDVQPALKEYEHDLNNISELSDVDETEAQNTMKSMLDDLVNNKTIIFERVSERIKNSADIPKPITAVE